MRYDNCIDKTDYTKESCFSVKSLSEFILTIFSETLSANNENIRLTWNYFVKITYFVRTDRYFKSCLTITFSKKYFCIFIWNRILKVKLQSKQYLKQRSIFIIENENLVLLHHFLLYRFLQVNWLTKKNKIKVTPFFMFRSGK